MITAHNRLVEQSFPSRLTQISEKSSESPVEDAAGTVSQKSSALVVEVESKLVRAQSFFKATRKPAPRTRNRLVRLTDTNLFLFTFFFTVSEKNEFSGRLFLRVFVSH